MRHDFIPQNRVSSRVRHCALCVLCLGLKYGVFRGAGKNKVKGEIKAKNPTVCVAGQELRVVEQYKLNGSMCTPSGAVTPEVSWSVDRTREAHLAVAGRFFAAAKFSLKCKKNVTSTLLETRLLYSSETWPPLPMGHAKRLERVQMRWTRKAVKRHRGEGCKETDAQIRAEFSVATVESKMRCRRLGFLAQLHTASPHASRATAGRRHATPLGLGDHW